MLDPSMKTNILMIITFYLMFRYVVIRPCETNALDWAGLALLMVLINIRLNEESENKTNYSKSNINKYHFAGIDKFKYIKQTQNKNNIFTFNKYNYCDYNYKYMYFDNFINTVYSSNNLLPLKRRAFDLASRSGQER